ncbi:hypothetical protein ACFQY4_24575 [Catellatospora bangladeshensis]|uniref:Vegetative cell wall protein gp1 n=1 Tax=Catellatospora bangladeshensis TaxID=310355 RepID=A0A8J3NJ05_9ACTN|nr:hypothetical protein [Catellatospora bangladeshensis]GIF81433.1 hypothetical protein Cba03nite_27820 [Catellatospora bangladeshensis]
MAALEPLGPPRPYEWRRALSVPGALWVCCAVVGSVLGQADALRFAALAGPLRRAATDPPVLAAWVIALLLAWAVAGTAALAGGGAVERLWLRQDWGRLGAALLRRRGRRWSAACAATETARGIALAPGATAADLAAFRNAAARRNRLALAEPTCPGPLADRMAALERRVDGQYALDLAAAWPLLWLLLPAAVRADVREARVRWEAAAGWAAWGVLFLLLVPVWWPAVLPGLLLCGWGRQLAAPAVDELARLTEAAVDVHGIELAHRLGVALDQQTLEPRGGKAVTAIARKGT